MFGMRDSVRALKFDAVVLGGGMCVLCVYAWTSGGGGCNVDPILRNLD